MVVVHYLERFGEAKRLDIDGLILDKLPDILDDTQKRHKIKNLLQVLKISGLIETEGKTWRISKSE